MLKIGEFSKLSRVSVRMLRHYDEIGLLKPARIDPDSEYRYYSPGQLPVISRITALKDMGFSLGEIGIMLKEDNPDRLEAMFAQKREALRALAEQTAFRMQLLDTAGARLRKEQKMSYQVSLKTIPERYCATVRMIIPTYEDEGMVWGVLQEEAGAVIPADPCLCAVTFVDEEYKEHNVEVLAWKTVKGTYPDTDRVKFMTLPAVTVASCTYQGDYEGIPKVYEAVLEWAQSNGYEMSEPMFNIYHVSPHETQNPEEFVTEVCYPVKKS